MHPRPLMLSASRKKKKKEKKEKEGINSELSPWRVTCCMHPPFLIFPRVSSPDPIAHNWIIKEGLLPKSVHGTIFKNKADRWPGRFYLASRGLRVGGARKRWFPNNGTFEKLNDHGWWIRNGGEQNNVSPLEFVKRVIWLRTIGGDAEKKISKNNFVSDSPRWRNRFKIYNDVGLKLVVIEAENAFPKSSW